MSSTTAKVLAVSVLAVVSLTACSSKDGGSPSAVNAPASVATSSGAPAAGSASAAGSAAASSAQSAGTPTPSAVVGNVASDTKNYTNATLAKALSGQKLGDVQTQTLSEGQLTEALKGINATAEIMKVATVKPAACKTATLANVDVIAKDSARAIAGADALPSVVMVRSESSPAAAVAADKAWDAANSACANYEATMSKKGQTSKVTSVSTLTPVNLSVARNGDGFSTSVTVNGKPAKQTAVTGTYGNVVIQAISPDGTDTPARLGVMVDDVARALAADMAQK